MAKMIWNPEMTLIKNSNQYTLALNEKYFKLPKKYYEYLNIAVRKEIEQTIIVDCFAEEDRNVVRKIIEKLQDLEILITEIPKRESQLNEVTLLLTEQCNFSCLHCCQDAGCEAKKTNELSFEEICKVVDKIEQLKVPYILLSGGEPMLRKDFTDIVNYIRKNFTGKISMITNGSFINENNISFLIENFDSISLSLDGCDKELTYAIRGKDVFDNVLRKADLLKKGGLKYVAVSAILPPSREAEEKFDKLCIEYGVKAEPRMYSMNGRGGINAKKIQQIYDTYLTKNGYKKYNPIEFEFLGCLGHCGACRGNLTIGSEGDVYPCNLLQDRRFWMGNVRESLDIIENYMESKGALEIEKLRMFEGMPCSNCEIKNVCWSCLSDMVSYESGLCSFKERCNYRKKSIYKYYEVSKNGHGNLDDNTV